MPVNVTGAKYAIRSLTEAGTTTVKIGVGTFVAGDFGATQRMVQLHSGAGAFKGIAWVRRFVSATQLELENRFVDADGVYATQVVGDQVLVSVNDREVAAPGWAVATPDNAVVTITDNVLMGTAGSETSLCFYTENKQFVLTNGFRFNGGVAVFGKLISYDGVSRESFVWSRECTVRPTEAYPSTGGSPAYNIWGTGGTSAHMFFFGGALGSPMRRSFFIGAEGTGAANKTFAFFGSRMYYACSSPNNGGIWPANESRHILFKTIHEADYNNANLIVWGNGVAKPASLGFPQIGAGTPLGMFRASSAVTPGADPDSRTVVSDLGSGTLVDDIGPNGDYDFINLITPGVTVSRFAGGTVPIRFRFADSYTNLQDRSTVVVRRGDGTIVSSVVNTTSPKFTATVVQATYSATGNGAATPTNFYTTFNFGVKCYGFQVVSGTHTPYTYPLGTAGNGTDLKLGGLINQVADTGVTLTETQALALSSKFAINTGTSTVTVLADATTDELYDYSVAWGCSSAANAAVPNLARYLFGYNGTRLSGFTNWSLVVASGATFSPGEKYRELELTGTGRVTVNGAITMPYRDADGLRVTVTGLDPEDFGITWFLRHRPTSGSTWTNVSGTGNNALILLAAGSYDVQTRAPGYEWESALGINTSNSLSLNAGLRYHVSANNTPQYTMAFDSDLADIFQYDATALKVAVTNTTAGILQAGFAELYQATQRIQHLPDLVWKWTAPVTANSTSQKIVIPDGNPISMFLTDASTNSVTITCPVIHASTGDSALDRIRGNASGYSIVLGSPGTAEAAGLATQIISGLGGAGYDQAQASQVAIKELIDQVQTLVEQVKARTDLVPNAPAAVGDAMTLTADYNAAKTAATQTSVDSVANAVGALGEPLQAANYTEPATAEEIAAQVEFQIIDDDDGRAVLQAIADKIMAEEVSSTVIARSVRAELATELGRIDVAISTRSTLTAQDMPDGLTAAEVWSADTRTLTEIAGLTTEQAAQLANVETLAEALPTLGDIEGSEVLAKAADVASIKATVEAIEPVDLSGVAGDVWQHTSRTLTETPGLTDAQAVQLRKLAHLHGIGARLVVTETTRVAGDVTQRVDTADDGSTTVEET
jgi:hypothetical protein